MKKYNPESMRAQIRQGTLHLIDGMLNAAVKVFRGEFGNDDVTINTIYHAVFQPVFALLELEK